MLSCYALDGQRVLIPPPTWIRAGRISALLEVPVKLTLDTVITERIQDKIINF